MKCTFLKAAASAMLGLGVLGVGDAFAQGESDGAWWQQRGVVRQGDVIIAPQQPGYRGTWRNPGWRNPGWQGSGWRHRHRPHWHNPGVGIYVAPAPRYYSRPTYTRRASGDAHVQWCYDQYRSYRAYDNSWQPYRGPRRECISPYS